MIKKKIQTIGIACFMLLATLTIVSITINAESPPCTIRGYVYVDEVITEPTEITLEINDQQITATDIYSDGYYELQCEHLFGKTGIFYVTLVGSTWKATETITITSEYAYKINLSINTSDEPINPTDNEPPSKVTGLTVVDAKDGKLDLSWDAATDNVGVSHYNIYRDGSFLITVTGTSYRNTGLTNGVTYTYEVSAVDTSGNEGEKSDPEDGTPTATYIPPSGDGDGDGDSDGDGDTPIVPSGDGDGDDDDEIIPNTPPEIIEFEESQTGTRNEGLSFYAIATDDDGHDVKYEFDWKDSNINTTDFMASGLRYNITHTWTTAGVYDITVKAIDDYQDGNGTWSATKSLRVLIDAHIVDSACAIDGYLTDDDSNGVYDKFHNNVDSSITDVIKENDSYKIDTNNDGEYDFTYNPDTGDCQEIEKESDEEPTPTEDDYTLYYILAIIIILILLVLFFLATRKKQKKK